MHRSLCSPWWLRQATTFSTCRLQWWAQCVSERFHLLKKQLVTAVAVFETHPCVVQCLVLIVMYENSKYPSGYENLDCIHFHTLTAYTYYETLHNHNFFFHQIMFIYSVYKTLSYPCCMVYDYNFFVFRIKRARAHRELYYVSPAPLLTASLSLLKQKTLKKQWFQMFSVTEQDFCIFICVCGIV